MFSIIDEIKRIREGKEFAIDLKNTNRHRLVINEEDGTKTAYYFSVPIYNDKTGRLLNLKFQKSDNQILYYGSNTEIIFADNVAIKNDNFNCIVDFNKKIAFHNEKELFCGENLIVPTTNGFVYKINCDKDKMFSFEINTSSSFYDIRANDKYFSLVNEFKTSLITISCIGAADTKENIISPAKISYQKIDNTKFLLTITACSPFAKWILFEINAYEEKLIQDTTVESNNPFVNNVFGGTAFLGNTHEFGEQWLYSKINFNKTTEMFDANIKKILLHLPYHNDLIHPLCAFKPTMRFCSFGSNWDNKVSKTDDAPIEAIMKNGYYTFDVSKYFIDKYNRFIENYGIIVKSKTNDSGFSVVSTGDSYYSPQIYEINFK